ncbi:MAG: type II secretion system F family protein [Acidobacteriota bacterium]
MEFLLGYLAPLSWRRGVVRRLAALHEAGGQLDASVEPPGSLPWPWSRYQAMEEDIRSSLADGASLEQAFGRWSNLIPDWELGLARAADRSDDPGPLLDTWSTLLEQCRRTRQLAVSTLIYPLAVGLISLLVTLIFLTRILPTFASLAASANTTLPAVTRVVGTVTGAVNGGWALILLAVLSSFVLLYHRRELREALFDRLPLLGPLRRCHHQVVLNEVVASTIDSDAELASGLRLAARAQPDSRRRRRLEAWATQVEDGGLDCIEAEGREHALLRRLRSSLRSDDPPAALRRDAARSVSRHEHQRRATVAWLEPALIVVLMLLIAPIVFGMALPVVDNASLLPRPW